MKGKDGSPLIPTSQKEVSPDVTVSTKKVSTHTHKTFKNKNQDQGRIEKLRENSLARVGIKAT